ncbi:MAG TPA: hypothetical protein VMV59_07075 [Candidatus Dormibacteraeota bacterium]|nr:hypothetical protein [Candidatus Dormibacteraeota bacterium]
MGWIGFALSTVLLVFVSGRVRGFIRRHAPFYAQWNILVVGLIVGVLFGVAVHLLGRFAMPIEGRTLLITFSATGQLAVAYIGYMPDPIDWAKKSRQTAIIAGVLYFVVTVALFAVDPPA